jgi:uncharacterized membrane protein
MTMSMGSVDAEAHASRSQGDFARGLNVGSGERWGSMLAGSALLLWGLARTRLTGLAAMAAGGALIYRGVTGYCHAYAALGVDRAPVEPREGNLGIKVERAVTVAVPPERVYRFWRSLENLPRVMSHVQSVESIGDRRSRWVVKGPAGTTLSWNAELINDQPNELIAWRSMQGSDVDHAGSVHFERTPDGRGTMVRVSLQYDPPGGRVGDRVAALLGADAARQIEKDLDQLGRVLESWEAPAKPSGEHVA